MRFSPSFYSLSLSFFSSKKKRKREKERRCWLKNNIRWKYARKRILGKGLRVPNAYLYSKGTGQLIESAYNSLKISRVDLHTICSKLRADVSSKRIPRTTGYCLYMAVHRETWWRHIGVDSRVNFVDGSTKLSISVPYLSFRSFRSTTVFHSVYALSVAQIFPNISIIRSVMF